MVSPVSSIQEMPAPLLRQLPEANRVALTEAGCEFDKTNYSFILNGQLVIPHGHACDRNLAYVREAIQAAEKCAAD